MNETSTLETPTTAKPIPEGMHTITPHLVCSGGGEAMDFYKRAFDAVELGRMQDPNGKLMHGMMRIGDSTIMLVDEYPEWGSVSPKTLKGTPVTLHLYVEDVDAFGEKAVQAGAKVIMPIADQFWGDRYGVLEDPFGHRWGVATHLRDPSPEEMKKAMEQAGNCG